MELPTSQRLKSDVEGAGFLVRREGADPVAELGRQLREEGDTAIGAAIVYECVGQCDAKSCCILWIVWLDSGVIDGELALGLARSACGRSRTTKVLYKTGSSPIR